MSQDATSATIDRKEYWNQYYAAAGSKGANPSQFAVFVHGESNTDRLVIDVGCGSGRDSFYFAANGHTVLGIDGSATAVEHCRRQAEQLHAGASFEHLLINDPRLVERGLQLRGERPGSDVIVYARFFIHAITEDEEAAFIEAAAKICDRGGLFAVEFRTKRDAEQSKVTPSHYRRFVDPLKFISTAAKFGLETNYFIEGYGYAKYKNDDAHVARILLSTEPRR